MPASGQVHDAHGRNRGRGRGRGGVIIGSDSRRLLAGASGERIGTADGQGRVRLTMRLPEGIKRHQDT
jgi:hypothetical protein